MRFLIAAVTAVIAVVFGGVIGLIGIVLAGIGYLIYRWGLLRPLLIFGGLYLLSILIPNNQLILGMKCTGLPDVPRCEQLAKEGWSRGWVQQAYGVKLIGTDYVYTRSSPDLTVRDRWHPAGRLIDDFFSRRGGTLF
jgi:hypothetical protein